MYIYIIKYIYIYTLCVWAKHATEVGTLPTNGV